MTFSWVAARIPDDSSKIAFVNEQIPERLKQRLEVTAPQLLSNKKPFVSLTHEGKSTLDLHKR